MARDDRVTLEWRSRAGATQWAECQLLVERAIQSLIDEANAAELGPKNMGMLARVGPLFSAIPFASGPYRRSLNGPLAEPKALSVIGTMDAPFNACQTVVLPPIAAAIAVTTVAPPRPSGSATAGG